MLDNLQLSLVNQDGSPAPIAELLEQAAEFNIPGLTTPEIDFLFRNSEAFYRRWKDDPITKILLLALRVESAKLAKQAADLSDLSSASELEIRTILIKQKTIDTLIRYVQSYQSPLRSCGRIQW